MTDTASYVYELTYDRPRHDTQLPGTVVRWLTSDDVVGFRVQSSADGTRMRLQFSFTTRTTMERFLETATHQEHLETLRSKYESVETGCWVNDAVTLRTDDNPTTASTENTPQIK